MDIPTAYFPHPVFAPGDRGDQPLPRVFISPQRYVQGQGVLDGIGRYISLMQAGRVALIGKVEKTDFNRPAGIHQPTEPPIF